VGKESLLGGNRRKSIEESYRQVARSWGAGKANIITGEKETEEKKNFIEENTGWARCGWHETRWISMGLA